ncbi:cytochrome c553 [Thioalbus denitrificans]|uniref:Cytochrome c553 n=2 Tax=Thioalbus denitrificans TaxID=547122 RepID=A0A369CGG1_9GAMM|nr:cytochrome c553 [Thioalbus denitrificans]
MMKKLTLLALAGLIVAGGANAAGDATAGKTKSATCVACHMTDGNSVNPIWPKLAGQHYDYLVKQLSDFRAGNRTDPTMAAMVAPLNDQDVLDLAAYFSSQTQAPGAANPDLVQQGEQIYTQGNPASGVAACTACHGASGLGMPQARFPRVGGQHPDYVKKQLNDFRAGVRGNDPNGMMRDVAMKLTDAEIEAVASYMAGLK